jgi:hypothetical protein
VDFFPLLLIFSYLVYSAYHHNMRAVGFIFLFIVCISQFIPAKFSRFYIVFIILSIILAQSISKQQWFENFEQNYDCVGIKTELNNEIFARDAKIHSLNITVNTIRTELKTKNEIISDQTSKIQELEKGSANYVNGLTQIVQDTS